jgi:hypothetical protein
VLDRLQRDRFAKAYDLTAFDFGERKAGMAPANIGRNDLRHCPAAARIAGAPRSSPSAPWRIKADRCAKSPAATSNNKVLTDDGIAMGYAEGVSSYQINVFTCIWFGFSRRSTPSMNIAGPEMPAISAQVNGFFENSVPGAAEFRALSL